jgi:hypothetical protein
MGNRFEHGASGKQDKRGHAGKQFLHGCLSRMTNITCIVRESLICQKTLMLTIFLFAG